MPSPLLDIIVYLCDLEVYWNNSKKINYSLNRLRPNINSISFGTEWLMRLYLLLINKWDPCVLKNIVTVFILTMTKLSRCWTVYTTTKQNLACAKLCLCVSIPYNSHSQQETSSNIGRQIIKTHYKKVYHCLWKTKNDCFT